MREVKGNRKAGHALRRKPFFGEPDVRAQTESAALERLVQRIDARLEPRPLDCEAEVLDTELKQSFGGPCGPWESSFRHGCEYTSIV